MQLEKYRVFCLDCKYIAWIELLCFVMLTVHTLCEVSHVDCTYIVCTVMFGRVDCTYIVWIVMFCVDCTYIVSIIMFCRVDCTYIVWTVMFCADCTYIVCTIMFCRVDCTYIVWTVMFCCVVCTYTVCTVMFLVWTVHTALTDRFTTEKRELVVKFWWHATGYCSL